MSNMLKNCTVFWRKVLEPCSRFLEIINHKKIKMMKIIAPEEFYIIPNNQSFTIGELKVIHNVFMESGIPNNWVTGQVILGKIEQVLNEIK